MQRTLLGLMLVVSLAFAGACGGDDKDGSGGDESTGGTTATGGATATGGTTEPVMCGGEACMQLSDLAPACCDEEKQRCGAVIFGTCTTAPDPDTRCPSAGVDEFAPPCCIEASNLCGLYVPVLGCQDLETAASVDVGGGGGEGVSLPDPITCDGMPVEPSTGGMDATGGAMGTGGDDEDAGM